jgi:hypothetical protein
VRVRSPRRRLGPRAQRACAACGHAGHGPRARRWPSRGLGRRRARAAHGAAALHGVGEAHRRTETAGWGVSAHRRRRATVGAATATAVRRRCGVDGGVGALGHGRSGGGQRRLAAHARLSGSGRRERGSGAATRGAVGASFSAIFDLLKYPKEISSKQLAGDFEKFWKNSWR